MDGVGDLIFNPWMTKQETLWLIDRAKESETFAEIGCWTGITTLNVAKRTRADYYCVDLWPDIDQNKDVCVTEHLKSRPKGWLYNEFSKNTAGLPNVKPVRMKTAEAPKNLVDVNFDVVFIDASHDYASVRADILAWFFKVKKGGYIAGHDYGVGMEYHVNKAVNELIPDRQIVPLTTIWYYRR